MNLADEADVVAATMSAFGVSAGEATRMLEEFSVAISCNGDCKHYKRSGPFWAQPVLSGRNSSPRIVIHTCPEGDPS